MFNIADISCRDGAHWSDVEVGTVKVILAFSVVCCDAGHGRFSDGDSD